jgi:hypothetical protein
MAGDADTSGSIAPSSRRCNVSLLLLATSVFFAGNAMIPGHGREEDSKAAEDANASDEEAAKYAVETLRGRVVFAAEAMAKLHGVKSAPDAKDRVLALETADGKLYPLVEDVRGRAFRVDEKLREFDIELLVRKYDGSPLRQVIGVYAVKKDGKDEVDYWCDVCAIAMYESKPCECCQAMNTMRLRRVEESPQAGGAKESPAK